MTRAFAVTYRMNSKDYKAPDFRLSEVRVEVFPNAANAQGSVDVWKTRVVDGPHETFSGFVASGPSDIDFGGPFMIRLFNTLAQETVDPTSPVSRFSSKDDARRRIFKLLQDRFPDQPGEGKEDGETLAGAPEPSTESEGAQAQPEHDAVEGSTEGSTQEGDEDMAAKKKGATKTKAKKAAKAATERKPRVKEPKAAGKVADFRPVRDNTDRAKVLRMMNGKNTASQIAHETGIEEKKIPTILFCLSRDSAIGYEFGPKGELRAVFPGSKTIKDAIKPSATEG